MTFIAQSGQVQGVSTSLNVNLASSAVVSTPVQPIGLTTPIAPVQPTQPVQPQPVVQQPVDETPTEEEPADEPEAVPGFTVRVENFEQLTFRKAFYLGRPMHINTAGLYVNYEEGYDLTGKQLVFTATPLGDGHYCEINDDKAIKQLQVVIPEANANGDYNCRVTVSDGTISYSTDYSVTYTALAENPNPQPASGYDFMFNMPTLGTIDGEPASNGLLIVKLANGQFSPITNEQLNELLAEEEL